MDTHLYGYTDLDCNTAYVQGTNLFVGSDVTCTGETRRIEITSATTVMVDLSSNKTLDNIKFVVKGQTASLTVVAAPKDNGIGQEKPGFRGNGGNNGKGWLRFLNAAYPQAKEPDGGAVAVGRQGFGGTATFDVQTYWQGNKAEFGGAVYADGGGIVTFNQVAHFSGNSAGTHGGALWCVGASCKFNAGAAFTDNTARGRGGAVHVCPSAGNVVFSGDTKFVRNTAETAAGAAVFIATAQFCTGATEFLGSTTFENNKAPATKGAVPWSEGAF